MNIICVNALYMSMFVSLSDFMSFTFIEKNVLITFNIFNNDNQNIKIDTKVYELYM